MFTDPTRTRSVVTYYATDRVDVWGGEAMTDRQTSYTLLTADRVIDAKGGAPIPFGAVLVLGDEIVEVGSASSIRAPDGADVEVVAYGDQTIMPGMVDCHTHNNGFGDGTVGDDLALLADELLTVQAARNARRSLFSGVTTIRENGPKNTTMFRLRDAINEGLMIGPRMVLCGPPISIIGGHMGYFGGEVTGENECRALARQLIKDGADYLKITATGGSTRTSFGLLPSFKRRRVESGYGRSTQVRQVNRYAQYFDARRDQLP